MTELERMVRDLKEARARGDYWKEEQEHQSAKRQEAEARVRELEAENVRLHELIGFEAARALTAETLVADAGGAAALLKRIVSLETIRRDENDRVPEEAVIVAAMKNWPTEEELRAWLKKEASPPAATVETEEE